MIEIMWKDSVHYRRPEGHTDIINAEQLIEKQKELFGFTYYSIREEGGPD